MSAMQQQVIENDPQQRVSSAKTRRVQPYLFFGGRCDEALDYYKSALGAEIVCKMRFSDSPMPVDETGCCGATPEGIMHAEFRIGESSLLASDGSSEKLPKPEGVSLTLSVATVEEAKSVFAALADGGEVQMPLEETFFARSFGMVADRFGFSWMVIVDKESPDPSAAGTCSAS